MRRNILVLMLCVLAIIASVKTASAFKPTHLNSNKNPNSCLGCHKAHARPLTPMLRDSPDRLCLICHGPYSTSPEERAKEVFSSFQKRSKHPVIETARYHRSDEVLPETNPSTPRHVSCYDCHESHTLGTDKKSGKIKGVSYSGIKKLAEKDSEVCYKCHSDSVNKPPQSDNIRFKFQPANPSYHPVEKPSRGRSVSLYKNIPQGSMIECSDCHEPHGSDYPPLLRKNYSLTDASESYYAYELCYSCHRRESILNNESFRGSTPTKQYGHREHIIFQRTSCRTCHAPHGSEMNNSLIEFDLTIVSGPGHYIPLSKGTATCILKCHGKEHR